VTLDRRLAKLEATLGPTERILRWLDEAHAFSRLDAYVNSLVDLGPEALPLDRLAREAATAARTALHGKPAEVVETAVRKALRETIFRFELVLRVNVIAHEWIERETLIYAVFAGQLALLASEDRTERLTDPAHLRRLALCRELTALRVSELRAAQEARSMAERRYLDAHAALFPDAVAAWAEQLRLAEELAVMADRLAELDGLPPSAPSDPDAVATRAAVLVADLVEPARVTTLEKLDEGRQALTIATGWLRAKMGSAETRPGLKA
jgi:hypothetical protein